MGIADIRGKRRRSLADYAFLSADTPSRDKPDALTTWDIKVENTDLFTYPIDSILPAGRHGDQFVISTGRESSRNVPGRLDLPDPSSAHVGVLERWGTSLSPPLFALYSNVLPKISLATLDLSSHAWLHRHALAMDWASPAIPRSVSGWDIEADIAHLRSLMDEDEQMNEASLGALRKFLDVYKLAKPKLFLLSNGNLSALWKGSDGEQIALDFLGEDVIAFATLGARAEMRDRATGQAKFASFSPLVAAFGLWEAVRLR